MFFKGEENNFEYFLSGIDSIPPSVVFAFTITISFSLRDHENLKVPLTRRELNFLTNSLLMGVNIFLMSGCAKRLSQWIVDQSYSAFGVICLA